MNFTYGSETTFEFELLPAEILEIILMEVDPSDVMCLKLSSKSVERALDRTKIVPRMLAKYYTVPLGTPLYTPMEEFARQVK